MRDGYYSDIPFEEYNKWEGLSDSQMKALKQSPMHYQNYLNKPFKDTPAMALGRAVHTAILEPLEFAERYRVCPEADGRTKEGKAIKAAFEAENEGFTGELITAAQDATCKAMVKSIAAHKTATKLLSLEGECEISMTWKDENGIPCKGRPDKFLPNHKMFIDLKTTIDGSPEKFPKTIGDFGYHRKASHIIDGHAIINEHPPIESYVFIVIESAEPHAVAVYYLDPEAIMHGQREATRLKAIYRECLSTNTWPGYPDEVIRINLPAWAYKKETENV